MNPAASPPIEFHPGRRRFVRIAAEAGLALPLFAAGCADRFDAGSSRPDPADVDGADVRLRILAFAVLAPSVHNLQPWWVDLHGDGFRLDIDPKGVLKAADPTGEQNILSQGSFLETLSIAATRFSLSARTTLTLQDPPVQSSEFPVPVASVRLDPGATPDPLFPFITTRATNRLPFLADGIEKTVLDRIRRDSEVEGTHLVFVRDDSRVAMLREILLEGIRRQTEDPDQFRDAVSTIRFSDKLMEERRDGLRLEDLGFRGFELLTTRWTANPRNAGQPGFREKVIRLAKLQVASANTFGVITTTASSPRDLIQAGRRLVRTHLAATRAGTAFQPFSQAMSFPDLKTQLASLVTGIPGEPRVVFRIGLGDPVPVTPRKPLFSFTKL